MRCFFPFLMVVFSLGLTSCGGYHFGGVKPEHLRKINSISVPLAKSQVVFPRAEAFATNAMVDSLVRDGTYRLGSQGSADATLLLTLEKLSFRQARASREDALRSEEIRLEVTVSYELIDSSREVIDEGRAKGYTRLFVDDNLQTARRNALPDALQRASNDIIARLADGI